MSRDPHTAGSRPAVGGTGVATPAELVAQRAADSASVAALPSVRAAAEKWQAAVGSIVGLFAIAGLIKGPSDLEALDPAWHLPTALFLAAAVALGLTATVLSARAAYGRPVWTTNLGSSYLLERRLALRDAVRDLRLALAAAVMSLVAVTLAVGIIWFGPRAVSTTYTLITTSSGLVCGDLTAVVASGLTIADRITDTSVTVPVGDIRVLVTTRVCPTVP